MAKAKGSFIGAWAFLIGVVLAIVLSLVDLQGQGYITALVVIGLIVGLLNVADQETTPFLLSGLVLIIASSFGQITISSALPWVGSVLGNLLVIFVPATIVVAIRNVFNIAKY
jgi:hypothetical protein